MPRDTLPDETVPERPPGQPVAGQRRRLQPMHRLWRLLPAQGRRRLLAEGVALLAPRPDPVPPSARAVAVIGEVARASGLGEGARLMHRALDGLGVPTWLMDSGVGVPGEPNDLRATGPQRPPPPGTALVLHVNAPLLPAALLRLGRGALRGRRVVGYWAWELPVLPQTWRVGLRFVHEVWVPSHFVADAVAGLIGGGAGPVLRVVPHPVAAAPPAPSRLDRAAFGLPAEAVITLVSFNLASSMTRKNPLGAIAAFRQAFGNRADRLLLLKLGHPEHYQADFAAIADAVAGAANVRIETRSLPTADAHALTNCSDIVLSLHRSEGFGLVPAEAMLLGKPVIATGWSGNMEFMDAECAALVDYTLTPATDPRGTYAVAGARWAEPDVGCAAAHLARLADDAPARVALGGRGRRAAQTRLGTRALAEAMLDLEGDVADTPIP